MYASVMAADEDTSRSRRHRLTITVSAELFEKLQVVAGPRKMSYWLEDAAWQRIRAERDRDLIGVGALVDAEEDLADLEAQPRWSGLAD